MKHAYFLFLLLATTPLVSQNVGINTSDPNSPLHIKCPEANNIGIRQESHNGAAQMGFFTSGIGGAYVQTHNNVPLRFTTNNGFTQMMLMTNGNFGIGNIDPTHKLTVHADGTGIVLKGVNNSSYIALQTGSNEAMLHTNGVPLRFNTFSGGSQMSLSTSGNLGIGTLSPTAKLEVLGDARIHTVLHVNQDLTVNNGKGIVRNVNATQMKVKRATISLAFNSLGEDQTFTTGYLNFGENFSSVAVYVGNSLSTEGIGGAWHKLLIVPYEVDTVNDRCRFKVTNVSDISISFDNDWEVILIGN